MLCLQKWILLYLVGSHHCAGITPCPMVTNMDANRDSSTSPNHPTHAIGILPKAWSEDLQLWPSIQLGGVTAIPSTPIRHSMTIQDSQWHLASGSRVKSSPGSVDPLDLVDDSPSPKTCVRSNWNFETMVCWCVLVFRERCSTVKLMDAYYPLRST